MILLIDNYDSFTYNLSQQVRKKTQQDVKVVRNDAISIAAIKALNPKAIILSPGPGKPEDAGICIELIKAYEHKKTPLLGVCLGHQAICKAFGGKIIPCQTPMHAKVAHIYHKHSPLYQHINQGFRAGRYHSLTADPITLPKSLLIQANTNENAIMGVKHHKAPIFGVQFHPESILTPAGDSIMSNFLNLIPGVLPC